MFSSEGMGCFWGAERKLWSQRGVYSTQVGYSGGYTPNPTYKEVCTGRCWSWHAGAASSQHKLVMAAPLLLLLLLHDL